MIKIGAMQTSEIFLVFAEKTIDNERLLDRAREMKVKMTPLLKMISP